MTELKTYGRWPTVGEVMEYYSREDILSFLYEVSKGGRWPLSFRRHSTGSRIGSGIGWTSAASASSCSS